MRALPTALAAATLTIAATLVPFAAASAATREAPGWSSTSNAPSAGSTPSTGARSAAAPSTDPTSAGTPSASASAAGAVPVTTSSAPDLTAGRSLTTTGTAVVLDVQDVTVRANGHTADSTLSVTGPTGTTLRGITLVIDTRTLAGIARLEPPSDTLWHCTDAAGVLTCTSSQEVALHTGSPVVLWYVHITSAAGVTAPAATFRTTLSATGVDPVSDDARIMITEDVDLVTKVSPERLDMRPGDTVDITVPVFNVGSEPVHGLVLTIHLRSEISPVDSYRNCAYATNVDSSGLGSTVVACTFDATILPGQGYQVGLRFRLRPDVFNGGMPIDLFFRWLASSRPNPDLPAGATRGTGGDLPLAPASGDGTGGGAAAWVQIRVIGDTPYDVTAVGGSVTGAVGQTVQARVGATNVGTVTLNSSMVSTGDPVVYVAVTTPPGTTITKVTVDGPEYPECFAYEQPVGADSPLRPYVPAHFCPLAGIVNIGETRWVTVSLRIDRVVPGASGVVGVLDVRGTDPRYDRNATNNTAALTVTATGGTGGGLPITGTPVARVAGGGAAMLAAGLVLLLLARRRGSPVHRQRRTR